MKARSVMSYYGSKYRLASEKRSPPVNLIQPSHVLPSRDNTAEAQQALLNANEWYRARPWPEAYQSTRHRLHLGDARDLSWLDNNSIHLVVCSPPYWNLKEYEDSDGQMGRVEDYSTFLDQLDAVWRECLRVLVPGGRVCCVVGDVCVPRSKTGRHHVVPLHSDIQVRVRRLGGALCGFDTLTPILWHKIANATTESVGNGAAYLGKPFQPNGVIKNDIEYILFFRKAGAYRSVSSEQKALSMINKDEHGAWFRSIWTDVKGASTRGGHPAPYPAELAERLVRMFSFAGDVVLDPFAGSGSTSVAAMRTGRHSIGNELEPKYLRLAHTRLIEEQARGPHVPCTDAHVSVDDAAHIHALPAQLDLFAPEEDA